MVTFPTAASTTVSDHSPRSALSGGTVQLLASSPVDVAEYFPDVSIGSGGSIVVAMSPALAVAPPSPPPDSSAPFGDGPLPPTPTAGIGFGGVQAAAASANDNVKSVRVMRATRERVAAFA
jgi:hypothetical protein